MFHTAIWSFLILAVSMTVKLCIFALLNYGAVGYHMQVTISFLLFVSNHHKYYNFIND